MIIDAPSARGIGAQPQSCDGKISASGYSYCHQGPKIIPVLPDLIAVSAPATSVAAKSTEIKPSLYKSA